MQKKLLTMAVASALAAPVVAFADVTVYGSIDTGIKQQSKVWTSATTDGSKLTVEPQIKKTNRWGFKGSDDLGGGLMANFTLEGGFASDTGSAALDLTRKVVVGLSSGGNSVDLGRNYTLNFSTQGIWDPMSHDYGGSALYEGVATQGVRYSNSVTGNFRFGAGGVAVQYAPGEVAGSSSQGTATAFAGDFAFGPVKIGAAFAKTKDATATGTADLKTTGLGAAYTLGAFVFRGGYGTEEINGGTKDKKLSLGVQYAMSPTLNGRVGYYDVKEQDAGGTEIGKGKVVVLTLEYSMSKNTIAYVALDRKTLSGNQNSSTAVIGNNSTSTIKVADGATGIGVGLSVSF
jgi:predicted porin